MALAEGRWTKVEGRVRGRFTMAKDLFVLVNCMHTYLGMQSLFFIIRFSACTLGDARSWDGVLKRFRSFVFFSNMHPHDHR